MGALPYDVVRVAGTSDETVAASTTNSVTLTGLTPDTTYSFAVHARDAAGNRSARSATVSVTTDEAAGVGCTVGYRAVNEWPGGFQGEIVIRNTGMTPLSGWTLAFTFPDGQTVTTMWGGTATQSGGAVTVRPASYTSTIPAAGSVTVGFTGTKGATNTAPASFTLDGAACAGA